MTTQEQINILKTLDNPFAKSLASQFERYGALSDKQMFWVDKLVSESINGPVEVERVELVNIAQLFQSVADKIKYPKIKLVVDGVTLQLGRAGDRSRFPGSINVTDGKKYGDNQWYGRINGGDFEPSRSCPDEVIEILKQLDNDPAGVMAEYGQRSGNCGFCRKALTDHRSVEVGYGPVCAEKWELPWGTKRIEVAA